MLMADSRKLVKWVIQSQLDRSMLGSHCQDVRNDGFALSRFQTSAMRHAADNTRPFVGSVMPDGGQGVAFNAAVDKKRATFT
jgi:hypothetical protein